jgi:ribokinase
LCSADYKINAGGKGLNQSIALARAGVATLHAGMIGKDGILLRDLLESSGVNVDHIMIGDCPTGHAIIQVEKAPGENSVLLYSGANTKIPTAQRWRNQGSWSPVFGNSY